MNWSFPEPSFSQSMRRKKLAGSGNEIEQDLIVRQKSNTSEGSNSAAKHENVVSKVPGLKKQARKRRSDSQLNGREMPVDVSAKYPNKGLAGCWIKAKVMVAAMKMKRQKRRNQRYKTTYVHNQHLRLQRRLSKHEQSLPPVHKFLSVDLI